MNIEPKAHLPWHLLQTEIADEGDFCLFIAAIKLFLDHLVSNNVWKHLEYQPEMGYLEKGSYLITRRWAWRGADFPMAWVSVQGHILALCALLFAGMGWGCM